MFVSETISKEEIFEAFKFFNEKAEKLRSMSFVKLALESESGLKLEIKLGNPTVATRTGPDQESIEAFLLTFRLFNQDNERCSFRNMANVYQSPLLEKKARDRFEYIRNTLNKFLDGPSYVQANGIPVTNRKILDVFLYGGLAHANLNRKKEFDDWMSQEPLATIMWNEFVFIVREFMYLIWQVRNLNHIAMNRSNLGHW